MHSMIGFGRSEFQVGSNSYTLELKTLNSRFCDIKIRLPWTEPEVELLLHKKIKETISRGRVDCSIRRANRESSTPAVQIDTNLLSQLSQVLESLQKTLPLTQENILQLIGPVKGVVQFEEADAPSSESIASPLAQALNEALEQLQRMRQKEGKQLKEALQQQITLLRSQKQTISQIAEAQAPENFETLSTRIKELLSESTAINDDRLLQEAAILADKADITEEIARLESHLLQLTDIIEEKGSIGRKLEFMLQEVQREINTIGSKSNNVELSRIVVEAKSTLEKLREQVQNVE